MAVALQVELAVSLPITVAVAGGLGALFSLVEVRASQGTAWRYVTGAWVTLALIGPVVGLQPGFAVDILQGGYGYAVERVPGRLASWAMAHARTPSPELHDLHLAFALALAAGLAAALAVRLARYGLALVPLGLSVLSFCTIHAALDSPATYLRSLLQTMWANATLVAMFATVAAALLLCVLCGVDVVAKAFGPPAEHPPDSNDGQQQEA